MLRKNIQPNDQHSSSCKFPYLLFVPMFTETMRK